MCGTLSVYDGCADVFGERKTALLAEAADGPLVRPRQLRAATRPAGRSKRRRNEKSLNETIIEYAGHRLLLRRGARFCVGTRTLRPCRASPATRSPGCTRSISSATAIERTWGRALRPCSSRATRWSSGFVSRTVRRRLIFLHGPSRAVRRTHLPGRHGNRRLGHRRVELRLAESERKYRELVEYANSIILRLERGRPDHLPERVRPAILRLYGGRIG